MRRRWPRRGRWHLEIRLQLRDDVYFHDGKALTAMDVQFSLDSARHPRGGAPYHRQALSSIDSVEILGRSSVRIRLHRTDSNVLRDLAEVPILPAHAYSDGLISRSVDVVGTGPYVLGAHDDREIILERAKNYWGPKPAIDRVVFVREPDAAEALTAAKEGRLDMVPELIAEHYPEQVNGRVLRAGSRVSTCVRRRFASC